MQNKFLGTGQRGFHPLRKMRVALSGARYAVLHDFAVAYKAVLSTLILLWCFWYRQWLDFNMVLLATGLMLVAEMFNTTIEALCDFLEPKKNEKIGIIKDIAAAAAGISILIWWIIFLLEAVHVWQGIQG
ncbi:diacylglycerol kinase [Candidatus Electronema sp. JM]|uniref:diacylglycerol kinase n=1 Tax=Candidatus Electronema sp. JM TaxID=3401571 RepID=UPI003AA85E91